MHSICCLGCCFFFCWLGSYTVFSSSMSVSFTPYTFHNFRFNCMNVSGGRVLVCATKQKRDGKRKREIIVSRMCLFCFVDSARKFFSKHTIELCARRILQVNHAHTHANIRKHQHSRHRFSFYAYEFVVWITCVLCMRFMEQNTNFVTFLSGIFGRFQAPRLCVVVCVRACVVYVRQNKQTKEYWNWFWIFNFFCCWCVKQGFLYFKHTIHCKRLWTQHNERMSQWRRGRGMYGIVWKANRCRHRRSHTILDVVSHCTKFVEPTMTMKRI